MRATALSQCPVPNCTLRPVPWFCSVHWPFVSPDVRRRIVRFVKTLRGEGLGDIPPTLRELLLLALRDVREAPVRLNVADRLAIALHAAVVGSAS